MTQTELAPAPVSAAAWLMLTGVAAGVGSAVISVVGGMALIDEFSRRAPGTGATPDLIAETVSGMRIGFFGGAALAVAFAVAIGLLIVPVRRGIRPARTATWILVGLSACCGGLGLVTTFERNPPNLYQLQYGTNPTEQRLNQVLAESIPGWSAAGSVVLSLVQVLAFTAVVVLLALPASNEFFRRRPLGGTA
jgi:hypothetical protein